MQTIGFTDNETAVLSIIFSLGLAGGMVAGGILGDAFAKHFSRYGWPSVNQCSIAVTAPLVALFFKGLPGQPLRISGTSTVAATAASTALCALQSATLVIQAMLCSSRCFHEALASHMPAVSSRCYACCRCCTVLQRSPWPDAQVCGVALCCTLLGGHCSSHGAVQQCGHVR